MRQPTRGTKGQILIGVVLAMLILLIIIPAVVKWVQIESRASVKDRQSTTAFNIASAAVERGYWKVKSSTGICALALAGAAIPGYNFDTTYTDIAGGTYRIQISSAGNQSVTIVGEGRDSSSSETRAISAVYKNQTIYSPMLTQGNLNWNSGLYVYWGPVMSQGSITLGSDNVAKFYFPRKFAQGDVVGTTNYPRDTTWPNPPNTDNVEWWAGYQAVPELPILDFAALRSSAAATNTLNVYGCVNSSSYTDVNTGATDNGPAPWDTRPSCASAGNHNLHFGFPWNHPLSPQYQPNTDYVWYWDGDVTISGSTITPSQTTGLRGTIIVRGNLTIDSGGTYNYTGPVPQNAWQDEERITSTAWDTSNPGEYPADIGLHQSSGVFNFGTDSWCLYGTSGCGERATVGIRGFVYVGGNLTLLQYLDINGAIWVNGSVYAQNPSITNATAIYFNDALQLPTLNVILIRQSWQEVAPSPQPWL